MRLVADILTCEREVSGVVDVRPEVYPKKELVAVCTDCGAELWRTAWESYSNYNRLKARALKELHCNCGKRSPRWEKLSNGDWEAKSKNGDFLVWRYGRIYKWRYRTYGKTSPDVIGFSYTKKDAFAACEKHKEWRSA